MREDWPDFDAFTLRELYESRDGIDGERFPDRLAYIEALIARREAGEAPEAAQETPAANEAPDAPPPSTPVGEATTSPVPGAATASAATAPPVPPTADNDVATLVVGRLTVGTLVRISTIASVVLALVSFVAYTALALLLLAFGGGFPAPDTVTLASSVLIGVLFFLLFFIAVVIGAAVSGAITGLTMALAMWIYARYEPLVLKFVPATHAE